MKLYRSYLQANFNDPKICYLEEFFLIRVFDFNSRVIHKNNLIINIGTHFSYYILLFMQHVLISIADFMK